INADPADFGVPADAGSPSRAATVFVRPSGAARAKQVVAPVAGSIAFASVQASLAAIGPSAPAGVVVGGSLNPSGTAVLVTPTSVSPAAVLFVVSSPADVPGAANTDESGTSDASSVPAD